jgi:hypothetical protein
MQPIELTPSERRQIVTEHLVNTTFQSNPLVEREERHGGPLWFDIAIITLTFAGEDAVEITIDHSLSKRMSPRPGGPKVLRGTYQAIVVQPQYLTGQMTLPDGSKLHFESLYGKLDYLYVEQPSFWKESLVLKVID